MLLVLFRKTHCQMKAHLGVLPFSFSSFIALYITFRNAPFWVNFCELKGLYRGLFFCMWMSLVSAHLLKRLSFLHWIAFAPLSSIRWLYLHDSISVPLMVVSILSPIPHLSWLLPLLSEFSNKAVATLLFFGVGWLFWIFYLST